MTSEELRRGFLQFFETKGHRIVESSKVFPQDDPTILFTNAGMNQFKNYFLGTEKPPFRRAASVQKCIRASGKHNDLEDVGKDGRHHTFFEMLGNWSFGDYYKREAVEWAWEFVTQVLKLPGDRLWASVYKDDDEAYALWRDTIGIKPEMIVRLGDKDRGDEENFWSMGDTGPCGPCSEIYYDFKPAENRNFITGSGSGEILELWNLVFMEFNREVDGSLSPLPEKHIDTGMGFERTLAVLENVKSDYETELFIPIMKGIEEIAGVRLSEDNVISFQVIADHVRCLIFAITDGVLPSNEGRGYVLRRILRRAVRHGKLLGLNTPFLHRLVNTVVDLMLDGYHELGERRATVETVIGREEELFFKTLDRGLEEFDRAVTWLIENGGTTLTGESAFKLHDTYGFPLDLTGIMAEERGLAVDRQGFDREMEAQRERAKRGAKFQVEVNGTDTDDWVFFREECDTLFAGYSNLVQPEMHLIKYRKSNGRIMLVFDRTPFYAEAGGQVGDAGIIEGMGTTIRVDDVVRSGGQFIHIGEIEMGQIEDVEYTGTVDGERRSRIMTNHTATHLLHYALREVIGHHAAQAGSLVAGDRLRFDFNHYQPLTGEQIEHIEDLVNRAVLSNIEVQVVEMSMEEAKATGAIMLFDEKYGDRVRVVQIDDLSRELCGGTHTARTGDIGLFKIIREGSISSGVRRIEAVTRIDSYNLQKRNETILKELAGLLGSDSDRLVARVSALQDEVANLKRDLKSERRRDVERQFDAERDFIQIDGHLFAHIDLTDSSPEEMRRLSDQIRTGTGSRVIVIAAVNDGKVSIVLSASDEAVQKGIHAGKLLGDTLSVLGGKGGGRPHMAQGGGIGKTDIVKLVTEVRERLKQG